MLPKNFDENGVLSQDYEVTLEEIRNSLLVTGPELMPSDWNISRRQWLVNNLEILVRQLWSAGIETVYVDGSFVTSKGIPGDIDACFQCDSLDWTSGALAKRLNEATQDKIWTWLTADRVIVPGYLKNRLPMWRTYRVEIYPYSLKRQNGILIDGVFHPFPDVFRRVKFTDRRKGILKLLKGKGD
jgi:hypothetical protein